MKKIKVIQIGIGHDHAGAIMTTMKHMPAYFDIAGVVVPETEETYWEERKKHYEGIPRLTLSEAFAIDDLDAAVIETEELTTTEHVQAALDRGLPVHMDKPGGLETEAYESMLATAKRKNLIFHTGYMYRYNPAVLKLLEDVRAGKLGEIHAVEAHMSCDHKPQKRQWLDQFPGGMTFYLGCHLIDLILTVCGVPEEIIPLNTCTRLDGVTADDYGMAVYRYANGISFAKSCAAEIGGYNRRQLVVCGSLGTVELKTFEHASEEKNTFCPLYTGVSEVYAEDTPNHTWRDKRKFYDTPTYDRYETMMASFCAMVNGEKTNTYSYEYEARLHRVLLASCGVDVDYKKEIEL